MNIGLNELDVCTQSRRVLNRLCVYVREWAMMHPWLIVTRGHLLRLKVTVDDDDFQKALDLG